MQPRNLADPEELGGIALAGRLGEGGMGTVYYGVTEDGTPVAVKTNPGRGDRGRRPAQARRRARWHDASL
jgi:hypothetical protein